MPATRKDGLHTRSGRRYSTCVSLTAAGRVRRGRAGAVPVTRSDTKTDKPMSLEDEPMSLEEAEAILAADPIYSAVRQKMGSNLNVHRILFGK
jgi:hypothetical protein